MIICRAAVHVSLEELSSFSGPEAYTLSTLLKRLTPLKEGPWKGFFDLRQSLPSSVLTS